ncbi:hypothetical protein [Streptomyces sp. L2]|uniref:hypothetical protein n=1 Tax=Streptomyces sp. L2 TaxID=2162665 RepID=UPI001011CD8B|nr:hypothetical protein [Streptomyces sp. L2]
MRTSIRTLAGISLATFAVVGLTTGASASADQQNNKRGIHQHETRQQAYERQLRAGQPTPVTPQEARTYDETKTFLAAARNNGESAKKINDLLTSGYWAGYPVSETVTKMAVTPSATSVTQTTTTTIVDSAYSKPAAPETRTAVIPAAASKTYCWNPGATYSLRAADGRRYAYFQESEHFCTRGSSIVSHDGSPTMHHKVYDWAGLLGWSWEGLDRSGSKGPEFYTYHKNKHGGLQTWRRGDFKYDPTHLDIGSLHRYPWIHIYGHGDGSDIVTWGR